MKRRGERFCIVLREESGKSIIAPGERGADRVASKTVKKCGGYETSVHNVDEAVMQGL